MISILLDCLFDALTINASSNLVLPTTNFLEKWFLLTGKIKSPSLTHRLLTFWRQIMSYLSTDERNIARSRFTGFSTRVYRAELSENKATQISDDFAIRLKEMAQYKLFGLKGGSEESLNVVLTEIDFFLADFNLLIKTIADANDLRSLTYSLNELRQILSFYRYDTPDNFLTEIQVNEFTDTGASLGHDAIIRDFKLKTQAIPFGVYAWLHYSKLYHKRNETINHELTAALSQSILSDYNNQPFAIIEYLFSNPTKAYNWEDWIWSLEERLSGVVYTLPAPEDMLSFGLVALLLENRLFHLTVPEVLLTNRSFEFVIQRSRSSLAFIKAAPDLWVSQFKFDNTADLLDACQSLETLLNQIGQKSEQLANKTMAGSNLDEAIVEAFKDSMRQQWKESENLGQVFDYFDAVQINPSHELKRVGVNANAENLKQAFTQAASVPPIIGLDFGKEVARNKEQLFGRVLREGGLPSKAEPNIVSGLFSAVEELKKKKFIPTVIFVTYPSLLREEITLNNSGNYMPSWRQTVSSFPFAYLGIFENNLPMVRVYSDLFRNHIIVADLRHAIRMLERENDDWFQKRLQIDVIQIDRAKATEIADRQKKDPASPDYENELNKIMNGVIIDIDEICDFVIVNKDAMQIFTLK